MPVVVSRKEQSESLFLVQCLSSVAGKSGDARKKLFAEVTPFPGVLPKMQ